MKELWTQTDFELGICARGQIGQPVEYGPPVGVAYGDAGAAPGTAAAAGTTGPENAEPEPLVLTSAAAALARERGIAATDAEGLALIMLEVDPEGFARRNPTLYMDIMRSQRVERLAAAQHAQQLADLASGKIKALSTRQIVDKMIQGLFVEGAEAQARTLERWGISADELAELGTAAAQGDAALDAHLGLEPLVEPLQPIEAHEGPQTARYDAAAAVDEPAAQQAPATRPERWEPPVQPDRPTLDAWVQAQDR